MTFCHMFACLCFTVFLKAVKYVDYPDFNIRTFFRMCPLSICFVGNIVLGLISTKVVSVPVMTTLRRLTALVIIPMEYFILGKLPTMYKVVPVLIMLLGALITGAGDLYFAPLGYAVVVLNDFATAGYLVFTNKAGNDDLGKFGTIFYNTLISCPLLFILCVIFGDFYYVYDFEYLRDPFFQLCFMGSAMLAFLVNLTTVWCTQVNSALTTSVTGQTKNILTTILGMILFHDFKPTLLANLGIFISITGSVFFAYLKYQEKQAKSAESKRSQIESPRMDSPVLSVTPNTEGSAEEKLGFLHHRTETSRASSISYERVRTPPAKA